MQPDASWFNAQACPFDIHSYVFERSNHQRMQYMYFIVDDDDDYDDKK